MTSPVSAIEAIEKLDDLLDRYFQIGVQQGLEHRAHDDREGSAQDACDEIRSVLLALARQAEALQRRAEEAEALVERLKLEAQAHAMEARGANSTINEIYQVVSGGKGEPGNWHGAAPVREKLEALQRESAELREAAGFVNPAMASLKGYERDLGDSLLDEYEIGRIEDSRHSPSFRIRVGHIRRLARALLGGSENAE